MEEAGGYMQRHWWKETLSDSSEVHRVDINLRAGDTHCELQVKGLRILTEFQNQHFCFVCRWMTIDIQSLFPHIWMVLTDPDHDIPWTLTDTLDFSSGPYCWGLACVLPPDIYISALQKINHGLFWVKSSPSCWCLMYIGGMFSC